MKTQELKIQLFALNGINRLILNGFDHLDSESSLEEEDDISYGTYTNIVSHIAYVDHLLSYLQKPVKTEGVLTVNEKGKYKVNKHSLKEDDLIEIYLEQENKWRLIALDEYDFLKYDGVRVRIRK